MHDQIHHLDVTAITRFLEEVTGVKAPKLRWGALKYRTKKMYTFGTSDFAFVSERLAKHNSEWGHEIFFSLRTRIPAPPPPGPKLSPKKKSGKAAKTTHPRKKWVNRAPGSFVVDIDCGSSDIIIKNARLRECLEIAESRACLPTHIVYSRNGFHFYWVIKETLVQTGIFDPEAIWRETQKALAGIYGGDPKIIGMNQMLRLPGSLHWKNEPTGFPVRVQRTGIESHLLDHVLSAHGLRTINQRLDQAFGSQPTSDRPSPVRRSAAPNSQISKIEKKEEEAPAISGIPIFEVELDLYEAIKKALAKGKSNLEALKRYLGVKKQTCSCPFHDDTSPSARVFKTEGGAYFKCHSSSCKVDFLDLQDLIKLKEGVEGKDLIVRTLEVLERDDLVQRIKGNLAPPSRAICDLIENEKILHGSNPLPFPPSYGLPNNYGTRAWVRPFLEDLIRLAKRKIRNSEGTFPASFMEISKGKNPKRTALKLYLLRLCGLVELAQMPEACKASQERFKILMKKRNDTSWHRIPLWTPEILQRAYQILVKAYSVGINTRSCTREQVREAFGAEMERMVFFGETTLPVNQLSTVEEMTEDDRLHQEWIASLTEEEIEREFGPPKPNESEDDCLGEDRGVA